MMNSVPPPVAGALRRPALALLAGLLLALGGCAAGPNPRDPFEPFNRKVMEFNEDIDAVAFKPVATAYKEFLPPLVRTGVSNFFGNMGDAWSFVNSLLQLKVQNAAEDFMRLNVNTFFGLGGLLDIASELNIERHKEDFGQTLGRWGMPAGPYIVLPLLGPSTMRDTLALPVDRQGDPLHDVNTWSTRGSLYLLRAVDKRANLLRATSVLEQAALDKYTFTRDAYLQRRRAEIFEGDTSETGGQEPQTEDETPPPPPSPAPERPPEGTGGEQPAAPPAR